MSVKVKCKFVCNSVTDNGRQKEVKFSAVYSNKGENKDFTEFTPVGTVSILIETTAPASNAFEPLKSYYLTFEEAPEQ